MKTIIIDKRNIKIAPKLGTPPKEKKPCNCGKKKEEKKEENEANNN